MTCYEHLRKKNIQDKETYHKLQSYFHALKNNKLDEYHDRREKKKQYKINQRQRKLMCVVRKDRTINSLLWRSEYAEKVGI